MEKQVREVAINSDYITLGQLLKFLDLVSTGGEAKAYLADHEIKINGEKEDRRGRKLRPGDEVILIEGTFRLISK